MACAWGIRVQTCHKIVKYEGVILSPFQHSQTISYWHPQNRKVFACFIQGHWQRWVQVLQCSGEIHVDEKWFFYHTRSLVHLLDSRWEEKAWPQCKMPFVEHVQAKKSSKNRPAGTWETKPVNVTKDIYCDILVNKLIPAVMEKWPHKHAPMIKIWIQQDNPNTHLKDSCDEMPRRWNTAREAHRQFKFEMLKQPPYSPDTNVLDLGFFCALQSLQWK